MRWVRRTRRGAVRPGALVAVLTVLAELAACDHDDQELDLRREFAACMRDQGLDFPDSVREKDGVSGPAGPVDGDWDAFEAARRICEAETGHRMD